MDRGPRPQEIGQDRASADRMVLDRFDQIGPMVFHEGFDRAPDIAILGLEKPDKSIRYGWMATRLFDDDPCGVLRKVVNLFEFARSEGLHRKNSACIEKWRRVTPRYLPEQWPPEKDCAEPAL